MARFDFILKDFEIVLEKLRFRLLVGPGRFKKKNMVKVGRRKKIETSHLSQGPKDPSLTPKT